MNILATLVLKYVNVKVKKGKYIPVQAMEAHRVVRG
jgi:hypothetical protein